nr:MAG TPA: hypothetical protein [Caudoviricetes sp.]
MVGIIYPIKDRSLLREALMLSISLYVNNVILRSCVMKSLRNVISNYADINENSYDEHELTAKDIVTTVTVTFVICVLATIMMFKDTVIW